MRVIVCGGRDFDFPVTVFDALNAFHKKTPITGLMQGGAKGADECARSWASFHKVPSFVCRAEWDKYGSAAGPKRNARMLEWGPDLVIAFPGGKGTQNMVRQASNAGIPVVRGMDLLNPHWQAPDL